MIKTSLIKHLRQVAVSYLYTNYNRQELKEFLIRLQNFHGLTIQNFNAHLKHTNKALRKKFFTDDLLLK